MSKKDETAAKAAQTENNASEVVEVSKAEFEEMKAQLALLMKQATSEDRMKSDAEKKYEADEKAMEQVRAANAAAEEEVELFISEGSLRSNKTAEVSINGVQYLVPKGQLVRVPRKVKEVIDNAIAQKKEAYGLQEKKAAESTFDETPGKIVVNA